MIRIVDCPVSCGVKYIGGETYYTKPDKFMADLHTVIERNYAVEAKRKWPSMISDFGGFTQFVMTHNSDKYDIGKAFEEFVNKHGLGTVIHTPPAKNPLYESIDKHSITVWVWTRDVDACRKFFGTTESKPEPTEAVNA